MRPTGLLRALGAALAVSLALPTGAAAAPSTTSTTAPLPSGRLVLASQTPWVGPGQELDIRVNVTSAASPAKLELAVSVFRAVSSRSEFLLTLQDRVRAPAVSTSATPLNQLAPDAAGAFTLRLPVQDPAQPADPTRLRLRTEGVYPVRVELREVGGGRTVDRFTTHLLYASPPEQGGVPLDFAWVMSLSAPPAVQPNGTRKLDPDAADRLAVLAARLVAHPNVAVNLQPSPETVEALAESSREADKSTAESLVKAATTDQVVAGSYVPVLPGSFGATGGEDEFAAQLDRGGDELARVLSVRPDPRTWATADRLDDGGLERLRNQQVDRLVLPEGDLVPANLPVTLAQPFDLASRGLRHPTAAASDHDLESHFTPAPAGADDPVLRAHALLADLAVIYFDRPGKARGVVAQSPRGWSPDPQFLDAVFDGLTSSPIVKAASLDTLFGTVPKATTGRAATLTRSLLPTPPPAALPLATIRSARARLESFSSMLESDNPIPDQLDEVLLAAESSDLRPRQRTQYIDGAEHRIAAELKHLEVPANRTITLTARQGDIPVTVRWTADYPVHVLLRVDSNKLTFPGGNNTRVIDLGRRNTTERFVVQARTSGAFPLRITLQAPAGGLVLGRSRFTVRSTAASGVGIALSVGAGVILLTWWARHLVRGRRNRRLVPA